MRACLGAVFVCAMVPSLARADDAMPERVSGETRSRTITFRAREAHVGASTIELCDARMSLRDRGITLSAGRIVLARDRVSARDHVVLRPCRARSGVALIADRLSLTPDGATFEGARLRLFGVTTPALPWIELVPANADGVARRVALLPPELAWRRDVSASFGVGAHLPIARRLAIEPRVRAGVLGSGGELRVVGRGVDAVGTTAVRYDGRAYGSVEGRAATRARTIALAADARVVDGPRQWSPSWNGLRHARVDAATGGASFTSGPLLVGSSIEAWRDATVAGSQFETAIPRASIGVDVGEGPLSIDGAFGVDATTNASAWTRASASAELAGNVGPLRLATRGVVDARDATGADVGSALLLGGSARLAWRRDLARGWSHRIEPMVGVATAISVTRSPTESRGRAVEPLPEEAGVVGIAGVSTSVVHDGLRVIELDVALRIPMVERPEARALHLRARTSLRAIAIESSAAWLADEEGSVEPAIASVRIESALGDRFRASFGLLHTTRGAGAVSVAGPFDAMAQGTLSLLPPGRATWIGATAFTPWMGPLGLFAGADVDAGRGELARARGGLALRDGCLSIATIVAWVRGDDAPEVGLAMELAQ